jgi:hypothetical protein
MLALQPLWRTAVACTNEIKNAENVHLAQASQGQPAVLSALNPEFWV